ncbi:histidine kinase [Shewanella schlegeliana]|uniref:Histidine kinase n=1 Tax=Shewanella schlegeliana TaxID=190308 RepID=A0ABS1T108_9GAMM|nr:histidine kinase [Shewanella schlegeliana]MBL4914463.1 histidine kinase [Shewanella schlegeliana]MCL1109721.1 histidine kinase [Shewanella schlegeliana]GIU33281.1 hypothetical protein TUM4433_27460 [Shewanella schlegeliana]
MDFRLITLSFMLWLSPAHSLTLEQLDQLNISVFQYPSEALNSINEIEQSLHTNLNPNATALRINAFKCETYLQLGENAAALNLARLNQAKAKQLRLDEARPYFLNCMAQAYLNYGNYQQALPLIHSAIAMSRRLEQPQALINGLWIRSQLDAQVQHNNTAIEDLRLALDLYPQVSKQNEQWLLTPIPYLNIAMAKLMIRVGEPKEARLFLDRALTDPLSGGKIALNLSIDAAKIAQLNQQTELREEYIQAARSKLAELGSSFELANAYQQIAFIDFSSGKYSSAEQLLRLSINTFKKEANNNATIGALRLLAQVNLAQHQEKLGLEQMNEAIGIAKQKKLYTDLKLCYAVLAKYFATKQNYKQAYDYQQKQFQAAENETLFIQSIWLSYLKSDLSRQKQLSYEQQKVTATVMPNPFLPDSVLPAILILCSFATFIAWSRKRSSRASQVIDKSIAIKPNSTGEQKLEEMLNISKQAGYPLSLLVLDTGAMLSRELPTMIEQLKAKLREQDLVQLGSEKQLLIMLPHTSEVRANNVIKQLSGTVALWKSDCKINIGLASMQQFDSLQSMIKRAQISQLRRQKPVS